jgi:fumarate reductase subunit C
MNGTANRPDKSKLYYPKMPATWWLKKPSSFLFMLRELSSVFIALFLVVFLIQIYQLTRSPEAYVAFSQKLSSPGWVILRIGSSVPIARRAAAPHRSPRGLSDCAWP